MHRSLQAGGGWGESHADILVLAWLDGFQQGVPRARLLPLLGLTGLGVGDPEAGVDAALHVVLRILQGEVGANEAGLSPQGGLLVP